MNNDTLTHHGVKGMRWGVRRYQNADASLTSKGKERVARELAKNMKKMDPVKLMSDDELRSSNTRAALEKNYRRNRAEAVGKSKLEKAKEITDISNQTVNQLSNINRRYQTPVHYKKMDLSKMSDHEMRERINRELLEKQYTQMFGEKEVNKGERYVQAILDAGSGALAVTSSSLAIALAIKQLKS
nr:MAG TPA: HP phosphatase domain protein [Caudoviricetes sp.]